MVGDINSVLNKMKKKKHLKNAHLTTKQTLKGKMPNVTTLLNYFDEFSISHSVHYGTIATVATKKNLILR